MKSLTKLVLRKSVIVVLACVCGVTAVYFGGQKAEEAVQTLATRPPYEPPTIVLDAGHGGMDGGCTSVNGVSEKGINLEILLHLRATYSSKLTLLSTEPSRTWQCIFNFISKPP